MRRPGLRPACAEELFDFDNFVPHREPDRVLEGEEALFHVQGKPAAPMPKAGPLKVPGSFLKLATAAPALSNLGLPRPGTPDIVEMLTGSKLPVSELGKTLNQLGAAAAKAGSEMQKAIDQAFSKFLTGRVR